MHVNDPIVARNHVIYANAGLTNHSEDARSQRIHTVINSTVVWSICKGRDIRTVGLELPCSAVPVMVTGRYNGAQGDHNAGSHRSGGGNGTGRVKSCGDRGRAPEVRIPGMESPVGRTGSFSGGHAGSVRIKTRPKMTIVEVEPADRAGDRWPARGRG